MLEVGEACPRADGFLVETGHAGDTFKPRLQSEAVVLSSARNLAQAYDKCQCQ